MSLLAMHKTHKSILDFFLKKQIRPVIYYIEFCLSSETANLTSKNGLFVYQHSKKFEAPSIFWNATTKSQ